MGVAPPIRAAAAVLLHRADRVWLGHRGDTRFLPGFWVFPGGAGEEGETPLQTAVRELSEETGLQLESGDILRPFARAITPAYSKYRFDVRVFSLELPSGREPEADGWELVGGEWMTVSEILARRARGELQLAPPTYRQLRQWATNSTVEHPFADPPLRNEQILPFGPGLTVVPVATRAIPPAAWTNASLLGKKRIWVVDPGGPEIEHLRRELERRVSGGAEIAGVILTHHHPDHIEGYLTLELTHLPLYCHPITAPLLPPNFPTPLSLEEGQALRPDQDFEIVPVFTPGHAPGHLALYLPQRKAVLAGDMISSLSSIVLPSDNGNLPHYLASLEKLRALECNLVIPSHGPPYGPGSDPFGKAIEHRHLRERQVSAVLTKGAFTDDEITSTLYRGLPELLFPAARANVRHHLWKLQAQGQAEESKGRWRAIAPQPGDRP